MTGPHRPSVRVGVEAEGRHAGELTVVALGVVPEAQVWAAQRASGATHVYWEVSVGEAPPWAAVRALVLDGVRVSVELDDAAVAGVPDALLATGALEVLARVPASWAGRVHVVKVPGGFGVSFAVLGQWVTTAPEAYADDVEVWRGERRA